MNHLLSHPSPVPGCFGCKTIGQGFLGLKSMQGPDPVQQVPVIADVGVRAGKRVGLHKVHWDGRQDATVYAPNIKFKTKAEIS